MEEILNELYSYEYFGIYLMISIIVLILLFIIVLLFGKKDQKKREIEATKKLQQINNDAFKDDSIEEKLEVSNLEQDVLENDTIILPTIEDIPSIDSITDNEIPEPVLPREEASVLEEPIATENIEEIEEAIDMPKLEEQIIEENSEITPLLQKVEEKPLIFNEFNFDLEIPKVETISPAVEPMVEQEEVEVPTFNFDEIIKSVEETKKEQTYSKGPEIFSSVYVPEKKVEDISKTEIKEEEELDFELPTLKKEVVKEQKEDITEEKIEIPILTDYNLDELSGESYTINK